MSVCYRRFDGSLADARGVVAVEAACWNDSPYSPQQLRSILSDEGWEQACLLAEAEGRIVGFAHALLVFTGDAFTWEIDFVGVHPDFRRRGVATELIRRAANAAPSATNKFRALIARENFVSASVFRQVGFTPTGFCVLYSLQLDGVQRDAPTGPTDVFFEPVRPGVWRAMPGSHQVWLQEVHTIHGAGLWPFGVDEGTPCSLLDAIYLHAVERSLHWIDVTLSQSQTETAGKLLDVGFRSLGNYQVWTRVPKASGS